MVQHLVFSDNDSDGGKVAAGVDSILNSQIGQHGSDQADEDSPGQAS